MTRLARRFAAWLGLGMLPAIGLGLGPALAGSGSACAAASTGAAHAALVVDTGAGTTTYCVALGASSVNGIQLVQRAGAQFGLSYRLGFGGQAVCMLNGVGGPSGDDCLTGQSMFWGYWIGDGSGGWTWSSIGAASTVVRGGDVQGWAWGSGMDGTTHPQPPATPISQVCKATPSPSPKPSGGGGHVGTASPSASPSPSPRPSPSTTASSSPHSSPRHRSPSPRPRPAGSRSRSPAADPTQVVAAAPLGGSGSGGSPLGVLLAVILAAALGVGGWLRLRSGRSTVMR